MFKKLGTIALTAAIALLGIQAAPAQADPLDATGDSVVGARSSYNFTLASINQQSVTMPSGVSSGSFRRSWNLRQVDLAAHAGETLSISGSLTKPDGSVQVISASSAGGSANINLSINAGGSSVQNNYSEGSVVIPASGVTGGSASVDLWLNNYDSSGVSQPLATGTYTFNAQIKIGATVMTNGATFTDPWSVQSNTFSYDVDGATFTAPADASSASVYSQVCVDSTKVAVGDTLTASVYSNGVVVSSPNLQWQWRGYSNNTSRTGSSNSVSTTVESGDIANGLTGRISRGFSVTPGSSYAVTYRIVDQDGASVTGSCAPAKAPKPTLTSTNGNFVVSGPLASMADDMSTDCQLFDAAAPTVVVSTKTNTYGNMGSVSCTFTAGLLVSGHSYFVKVRGGYQMEVKGEWSDASDSVLKVASGVTFTSPISGLANAGGKLSIISTDVLGNNAASTLSTSSDGANGLFVIESEATADNWGGSIVSAVKVRHVSATGADSTFAGNGTLVATPGAQDYVSNARFAWYGARDKFVLSNANYPMVGQGAAEFQFTTGTMNSATVTKTTISGASLTAFCVSQLGAGYTAIQNGGPSSPPSVNILPISAPTSAPLYQLTCLKTAVINSMPVSTSIPVLVTIADATTVNLVKVLATLSASVDTASASYSVNPAAGVNDTAITVFVRSAKQTSSTTSTTDARVIYTFKKDLSVATSPATWTSVATEPSIRVAALNDGTIWGTLQEGNSFRLLKLVGDTLTQTAITIDTNADMASPVLAFPNGLQPGNSSLISLVRTNNPVTATASALATVDTTSGAMTTYEVAKYGFASGSGVVSSYMVNSKNLYWLLTDTAAPTKYSIARWRDPAYTGSGEPNPPVVVADTTAPTVTGSAAVAVAAGVTAVGTYTASETSTWSLSGTNASLFNIVGGVVTFKSAAAAGVYNIVVEATDAANNKGTKAVTVTVAAPVVLKKAPKFPTLALKVKKGKSLTIALHATKGTAKTAANADGLVTKVTLASSAKGVCTLTPILKSKKISGYTLKGVKVDASKCAVTIAVTGNASFASLSKTIKVAVTK